MKVYILVQNYEADCDFAWDYPSYSICDAFYTNKEAEEAKKILEKEHGGETWTEDDFNCCYVIEEVELKPIKPVKDPNLEKGGWIGRETECCGVCGNNLRLSAKFCDRCGREVNREELTKKYVTKLTRRL